MQRETKDKNQLKEISGLALCDEGQTPDKLESQTQAEAAHDQIVPRPCQGFEPLSPGGPLIRSDVGGGGGWCRGQTPIPLLLQMLAGACNFSHLYAVSFILPLQRDKIAIKSALSSGKILNIVRVRGARYANDNV